MKRPPFIRHITRVITASFALLSLAGPRTAPAAGLQLKNLADAPVADRFTLPTDLVWPSTVGEGDICLWYKDKFGAVSFGVDDNIVTDHSWWTERMNLYGWKMSWFVITGGGLFCASNATYGCWSDFSTLRDLGHSIGSHTVTHQNNDDTRPDSEIITEYGDSQSAIQANIGAGEGAALAYAFGTGKRTIADDYYLAARGTVGGINQANRIDYLNTKSNSSTGLNTNYVEAILTGVSPGPAWLTDARHKRGWSNAHYHSLNTSTNTVDADLAYLSTQENDIWVGTFDDIVRYGQERDTAVLTITEATAQRIVFSVSDDMDDTLYDFPLTVKFRVDDSWVSSRATQNGQSVDSWIVTHGSQTFALVQAIPDQGPVILTSASAPHISIRLG